MCLLQQNAVTKELTILFWVTVIVKPNHFWVSAHEGEKQRKIS